MNPLNRTQPSNFQLCSNQSTNHNYLVWGEGGPPPKLLLARDLMFVDQSLEVLAESGFSSHSMTHSCSTKKIALPRQAEKSRHRGCVRIICEGTYVLTQPGQNSHKSPNLATVLTATLRVIRGFFVKKLFCLLVSTIFNQC